MIAAFLLPFPVRGERAPYLWFFYKLLSAIKEEMAFLGHSDYLRNPREWIEEDRWEVGEDNNKLTFIQCALSLKVLASFFINSSCNF